MAVAQLAVPEAGVPWGTGVGPVVGGVVLTAARPVRASRSLPQPDILHRERPRAAGAGPGLQPQQAVLPSQLRGRLQGQVLGHPKRHRARQDPGGALPLVRTSLHAGPG